MIYLIIKMEQQCKLHVKMLYILEDFIFMNKKGNDSRFSLTDYTIEENGKTFESDSMGVPAVIVVRLSDAKRIELFY